MAGINIWQLLIIAVIVVLLFGTNKLRTLGFDLGASIKGFKKAIGDEDQNKADTTTAGKDADFEQKNIAEKKADTAEQPENKNKEQV